MIFIYNPQIGWCDPQIGTILLSIDDDYYFFFIFL